MNNAGWSSQVARRAHNPEVAGSNPVPATRLSSVFYFKHRCFFIMTVDRSSFTAHVAQQVRAYPW